jgi:lysophospholipid acyltransferase (LPLAT)-like uncharacterized protein
LRSIETRLTPAQLRKARLIAAAVVPAIRAAGVTYRWRTEGLEHYDAILRSGRQPILGFWHGRILPATYFFRNRGIVVMISLNFDGEWIGRTIERFGYGVARGSSSRGGARALVELRRSLAAGKPAGFALDGPRGPARVAQPGAVFLAGATGQPILPFHIEASRSVTLRSWDRTQIPSPFARVAVAVGQPLVVPDIGEQTIERCRQELEARLTALETRAHRLLVA